MTIQELTEKIKKFEGFRALPYDDLQPNTILKYGTQIKGTLTIGYGRTKNVYIGEVTTKEKEDKWLEKKVNSVYEKVRNTMLKYGYYSLSTNQILALTDFTYNLGTENLLKLIDYGKRDIPTIADKILLYNKCKGKELDGLKKRRQWEHDLFFSHSEQQKKENVSLETWNINYKYNSHDVQELCNKIIKDNNLQYEPLEIDGVLGVKSTDLIFTLLYKGYGYL